MTLTLAASHTIGEFLLPGWLAAFRALGLPHTYTALRVEPARLEATVRALRDGTYDGLNVTVPHKEAAFRLVASRDGACGW